MTLKNLATTKQKVIVAVESVLFEIGWQKASRWPLTQYYETVEPGKTLSFSIEVRKVLSKSGQREVLSRMTKPEGKLRIYHQTTDQEPKDWANDSYEGDDQMYHPDPIARMDMNSEVEWGFVEIELSCEKETKVMKKQKKQFIEMKKTPEEKKKEKKCIIL